MLGVAHRAGERELLMKLREQGKTLFGLELGDGRCAAGALLSLDALAEVRTRGTRGGLAPTEAIARAGWRLLFEVRACGPAAWFGGPGRIALALGIGHGSVHQGFAAARTPARSRQKENGGSRRYEKSRRHGLTPVQRRRAYFAQAQL